MSDKNQNISLNAGGNMTGITVAGGDISGTVTRSNNFVTVTLLKRQNLPIYLERV